MIVGLGIDIIGVARIRDVHGRHGRHFLDRTYTTDEQAYCLQAREPAERLAARWAVKEAAMKALGTGWAEGVGFTQIALLPNPANGPPRLILTGQAAERAAMLGAARWHASVSHADGMAVAVVILES
jgi:holo-[acyl-carrier protein] synthase